MQKTLVRTEPRIIEKIGRTIDTISEYLCVFRVCDPLGDYGKDLV